MSADRVDQPVPNHGIPGKTLAAEREALGWTVEQVADQLKLAVRQVVALEEGDYASLPGPAVVRGFVRAYAKIVKLDAAPLVAQIALDTGETGDTMSTAPRRDSKPATFSQSRFPTNGKRSSKMPLLAIGGVVLLVAAAAGAWQAGLIPSSLVARTAPAAPAAGDAVLTPLPPPVQDGTLTAPAPAAVPADAHPPVINNAVPLISVPPATQPGGTAPVPGTTPAAPAAGVPAAAAPGAPAAAQDALVLSVREDSWIEVRPAQKGRPLFSGLVKAGTIETVTVKEPVMLVVGKPAAVSATLRGAPVALPEAPGGRVARINLQ
ncbi:DUF4115 domain-containing protein [Massilia sp. PAMC28688]|uniref:helix-turn-helix domain-containing protein n=1 Tax=Massilia sp. PAMC28688 TaxID=2861283 RepID=UPI001C628150|nr:helix-turn-helix domain-containing protein [Massilia sp. PAMC28688]QYF92308.1 DUF4115 domain-containing protein [Massilia sp. PAMC28688]